MSVYNHRSMVPPPQNRIMEMLEGIRTEFDRLTQEVYHCKSEKDDFEHKMNSQIREMHSFQQGLLELERSQQALKAQYEEEIARLRQQIEQAQAHNGHGASASSAAIHRQRQQQPQLPPPSIGPGSNSFGSIMNSGNSNQPPGLLAPPQMDERPPHPGYPSSQPAPQVPIPPSSASSYMTGSNMPQGAPPGPGYGYSSRSGPPGTPNSQPAPTLPGDSMAQKRKSGSSASGISPQGPPPPGAMIPSARAKSQMPGAMAGGLADIDPDSVPANMKVEGQDWFALFNPKTPRYLKVDLVHSLEHNSVVCCVKFSADGRYMATGCNRATYIYEVATAHRVCVLQDKNAQKDGDLYIRSVCFSPDGAFLATGAEDKQIRVWDIANGTIRNVFTGHEQDIYSLDFSRDGRIIVSGSGDRTVRIWSMVENKCLHVISIKDVDLKDPGVTSVAISPDGRLVAAGSLDKMVRVWDVHTARFLERLEGHKDSVYSVAFMPDGRTLVSGSLDKTIKLWQLGTNEVRGYGSDRDRNRGPCKMTFTGHKDFVLSVACTPDGRWIVSGSKDRGVQFWDPQTGQTQFMLQGHRNSVISVAISPSGRPLFATGSGDSLARIWSYEPLA